VRDTAYDVRAMERDYTMVAWSDKLRLRFEDHVRKDVYTKLENGKQHLSQEECERIKLAIPQKYASGSEVFDEIAKSREGMVILVWLRLRPAHSLGDVKYLLASGQADRFFYSDEERKERKAIFQKMFDTGGCTKDEERRFFALGGKREDLQDVRERRQQAQSVKPAPTLAERVALLEREVAALKRLAAEGGVTVAAGVDDEDETEDDEDEG
jgi:hypothetical protein